MINKFACYQQRSGSDSNEHTSVIVELIESENGIELIVLRQVTTDSASSSTTKSKEELKLFDLSREQTLEIVKLLENWLKSESYPIMDATIEDVDGEHIDEQLEIWGRETENITNEFEGITVSVDEREVKFSYWLEAKEELRNISLPTPEAVNRGVPQDIKNVEKLYHTFYDFFTVEYSGTTGYFKKNGPVEAEQSAVYRIEQIFNRFGEIALPLQERRSGREPLTMDDEADVQYLLYSLLKLHFDDVRRETHTEQHSSVSPRIDFLVKNATIGIEVKRASETRQAKKLRTELAEDKEQYRLDNNVDTLLVFVYDPEKQIENKAEFEASFEQDTPQMTTKVTVTR